jgi:target of rapamycin complex 2 subunit AVO2
MSRRHHTKEILEDSARAVYDARKNARRPPYVQMRGMSLDEERPLPPKKGWKRPPRLRSGSGTTTTSDSADELIAQAPPSQSSVSSAASSQPSGPSSSTGSMSHINPPPRSQSHGVMNGQTETSRPPLPPSQPASNASLGITPTTHSALSPIASRVLASDAGAMAEYMKRNRSGSHGESPRHVIVQASSPHSANTTPPIMEEPIAQKYSLRRLRPSLSAAALRQTPPPVSVVPAASGTGPSRFRAGTNPSPNLRPQFFPTAPSSAGPDEAAERVPAPRRTATNGTVSSRHEPRNVSPARRSPTITPPALPPKDDYQLHRRGPSVS